VTDRVRAIETWAECSWFGMARSSDSSPRATLLAGSVLAGAGEAAWDDPVVKAHGRAKETYPDVPPPDYPLTSEGGDLPVFASPNDERIDRSRLSRSLLGPLALPATPASGETGFGPRWTSGDAAGRMGGTQAGG
jgi:hypothetical protein